MIRLRMLGFLSVHAPKRTMVYANSILKTLDTSVNISREKTQTLDGGDRLLQWDTGQHSHTVLLRN
jgi:hypothetical protein